MSFVTGIVGGLLGANAAGNASNAEVQGAQAAQKTIEQNQKDANAAQTTALGNVTTAEQPYQTLGSTSADKLNSLLGTFKAPTLEEAENTPGFKFNLETGTNAINQNAAANGTLLTGNTGVALEKFGEGLAQNTYQQQYQDALQAYLANSNTLQSGVNAGLDSTGQLSQANLTTAGNTANIDMTSAQQIAQQQNNAAAARASGYLGKAKAYSSMLGGGADLGGSIMEGLSGGGGFGDVLSSVAGLAMA